MPLRTVQSPTEFAAYFEAAERLVTRYFAAFEKDPTTGSITISGERYTLVRAGSMSAEFFDVVRQLYAEDDAAEAFRVARSLLYDLAHAMAISDADVCSKTMESHEPITLMTAGPVHFAHAGWASVDVKPESAPVEGEDYLLVYDHPYSFEADAWLASGRQTEAPVCVMSAGYSSGWCERAYQQPLVATEITCRAKGDDTCRFVMAPPSRIEERVHAYLAMHPSVAQQAGTAFQIPGFFARKALSESLREQADRLGAYSLELERRVDERTAALTAANRALLRSQHFNERLLDVMPGGVVQVTADGEIVLANAEGQRILGMTLDPESKLYTQDFEYLVHDEEGAPIAVEDFPVSRAIASGQVQPPKTMGVTRPDGEVAWAIFRAAPMRDFEDGTITGAVVTFVDITERKHREDERRALEAQMREAQRLESLGVLAGGIAHDFNNLLVGILGQASVVASELDEASPHSESIRQIELAATRAADLARQMLAYSGGAHRQAKTVDLSSLTQEMLELVRASIPKAATVKVVCPPEPVTVNGDPAQLRQVVMNLIINAAEAVERNPQGDGGTVTVTIGRLNVEPSSKRATPVTATPVQGARDPVTPGSYVYLEVRDNGPGMEPDTLARIFDPFFTTKAAGRGLGLAAVQGIVQSHRGRLLIDSRPGDGTSFRMLLPQVGTTATQAPEQPSVVDANFGGGMWLVVDDEPIVRTLARVILNKFGFDVMEARDGLEGVTMFRTHRESIRGVLLDVTMPVMSGREALERIWTDQPDVPVIISSGYDADETMAQLPEGGRAAFLPKPFRFEDMRHAITTLLGEKDR